MAPLQGITVIDFTELLPGPFLTQSLVELGAKVIKVERPPHGDNARRMAPGVFNAANRGKHCVAADLKSPRDRAMVVELIRAADVFIESYRPGVMKRLGLDYETVRSIREDMVYASLTGYGQSGSRALLPGHDLNYQAASGALALSGLPDGEPEHVYGLPVADLCGAVYGLSAVTAALLQRERTGIGQHLDIAIADCLTHWVNPRLGAYQAHGIDDLSHQRQDALNKPAYGVFRTADGHDLTVCALENHFWRQLTQVLDLAPFDSDDYFDFDARARVASEIRSLMKQRIASWEGAALETALKAADVPVLRVVPPNDVLAGAAAVERGLAAAGADGLLVRFPVRLKGMNDIEVPARPEDYGAILDDGEPGRRF